MSFVFTISEINLNRIESKFHFNRMQRMNKIIMQIVSENLGWKVVVVAVSSQ